MKKLKISSKTGLRIFTIEDIRSWKPCYDPKKYLSKDWKGTALDLIADKGIPQPDILWVLLRSDITSERAMRLFAVWCYRQTLSWISDPDPRSLEAANVAERFAYGNATQEELQVAYSAARSAERSAARSVTFSAEFATPAADSAGWLSARSAVHSALSAAPLDIETKQLEKLKEMLLTEGEERLSKRKKE